MAFESNTINPTGYSNCTCFQVPSSAVAAQLVTGSPTPAGIPASEIILSAPSSNTAPVYIGTSNAVTTSTGIPVSPGQSIPVHLANTNMLWVISAAAQVLGVMANA